MSDRLVGVVDQIIAILGQLAPDEADLAMIAVRLKMLELSKNLQQPRAYGRAELLALADKQINGLSLSLRRLAIGGLVTNEQVATVLGLLESKRDAAVTKIAGVSIAGLNLALLPVISKSFWNASTQMAIFDDGNHQGLNRLDDDIILDLCHPSNDAAYWCIDVEAHSPKYMSLPELEEVIQNMLNRYCLTVTETTALGYYSQLALHNQVCAAGSQLRNSNRAIILSRDDSDTFILDSADLKDCGANWYVISCADRL
ncbi:MAG: hypothetical protein WCX71_05065 [Candidatus Buchananbacteria bacterium]